MLGFAPALVNPSRLVDPAREPVTTPRRGMAALAVVFVAVASALPGCGISSQEKSRDLARVAKDWCLSIRASQVIPVYPLTQDLMPGDVFLTTTAIGDEVKLFEDRGFLPLDQHLARLPIDRSGGMDDVGDALRDFYAGRFDEQDQSFPAKVPWDSFPQAKFPTYSFEVSRSGGLNVAVPVQGVPVGFNFLGAAAATGTISIAQATTIGLDIDRLNPMVDRWAHDHGDLLRPYGTFPGDPDATPTYLRVVTRVYYTGMVDIQLSDKNAQGAELAAGFELPLKTTGDIQPTATNAEAYQKVADNLNAGLLQNKMIGGKVRVVSASRRSVGLQEEFDEPVVIGYLAYDRLIFADGSLGPPVSTLVRVQGRRAVQPAYLNFKLPGVIQAWYTKDEGARVPLIQAWLDQHAHGLRSSDVLVDDAKYLDLQRRLIRDLNIR